MCIRDSVGAVHQVRVPGHFAALAGDVARVRLAGPVAVAIVHVAIAAQGLVAIVAQRAAIVLLSLIHI